MLKHANMGFYDLQLVRGGTLSATLGSLAVAIAPFAGFIRNIYAAVGSAVNGTIPLKLDVNKNGTTIFAATDTQISFAGTTGAASYGTFTTDPPQVAAGDVFTLDVDVPGTAHIGCAVVLTISRENPAVTGTESDLTVVR